MIKLRDDGHIVAISKPSCWLNYDGQNFSLIIFFYNPWGFIRLPMHVVCIREGVYSCALLNEPPRVLNKLNEIFALKFFGSLSLKMVVLSRKMM